MAASTHLHLNPESVRTSRKLGFSAAVASTIFGAMYLLGLTINLIRSGTPYSQAEPMQIISAVIAILWDICLLIMFASLRWNVADEKKFLAELGLVFMVIVCALSTVNWFAQLVVVPNAVRLGDATILRLADAHSQLSITYAMEHLGWGIFFGLATLCMAFAFSGRGLEMWLRWLLFACGTLSLLHVPGVVIYSPALYFLGYIAWGVVLPVASLLLAVWYRRGAQDNST